MPEGTGRAHFLFFNLGSWQEKGRDYSLKKTAFQMAQEPALEGSSLAVSLASTTFQTSKSKAAFVGGSEQNPLKQEVCPTHPKLDVRLLKKSVDHACPENKLF